MPRALCFCVFSVFSVFSGVFEIICANNECEVDDDADGDVDADNDACVDADHMKQLVWMTRWMM